MSQCGFYLPIEQNTPRQSSSLSLCHHFESNIKKPFVCIVNEETNVVTQFLDALTNSEPDDARFYISKNYITSFDLQELSLFFHDTKQYKCLIQAAFMQPPKNCKTSSIVIENKTTKQDTIIHVHLVHEPDRYGNWKIYSIDRE